MSKDNLRFARENLDIRERTALDLQEKLGFRKNEAVVSACLASIKRDVERALERGQPKVFLTIFGGTKGGKHRIVQIDESRFGEIKELAEKVLDLKSQQTHGNLIDRDTLKAAYNSYTYQTRKYGLRGDDSCHGARRGFA